VLTANGAVNDPSATISYQWQRDEADIFSATSSAYTVAEIDEGHTIRVVETATAGSASATSTSDPTALITDMTLGFTSSASVNNTAPKTGDILSAINGPLNDDDANVTGYQWQQRVGGVWSAADVHGGLDQRLPRAPRDRDGDRYRRGLNGVGVAVDVGGREVREYIRQT
jgi:hypothetical protein